MAVISAIGPGKYKSTTCRQEEAEFAFRIFVTSQESLDDPSPNGLPTVAVRGYWYYRNVDWKLSGRDDVLLFEAASTRQVQLCSRPLEPGDVRITTARAFIDAEMDEIPTKVKRRLTMLKTCRSHSQYGLAGALRNMPRSCDGPWEVQVRNLRLSPGAAKTARTDEGRPRRVS